MAPNSNGMKLPAITVIFALLASQGSSSSVARQLSLALGDAIDSLDRSLAYFSNHLEDINFDAIIGTRFADGQLSLVLDRYSEPAQQRKYPEFREVFRKIWFCRETAKHISDMAIPQFHTIDDVTDVKVLGGIVQPGFWRLDTPPRKLYATAEEAAYSATGEAMTENDSDECVSQLFTGSGEAGSSGCHITDHCVHLMTSPGYHGYSLTHEIFYLAIGLMSPCAEKLKGKIAAQGSPSDNIDELANEYCSAIYEEAEEIARAGFPDDKQDLFMEQGALCGVFGFENFFKPEWLREIISWQRPSGCFSNVTFVDLMDRRSLGSHNVGIYGSRIHAIIKRRERILADTCLSHRTAVAVGVLSEYIKFLVDALMGKIRMH